MPGVKFTRQAAERIARATERVEQEPNIGHDVKRHGRTPYGIQSRLIIAKAAMTSDDTGYTCKYLEADGTEGGEITCRRANGADVADGDVGVLTLDSSGQYIFFLKEGDTVANTVYTPNNVRLIQEVGAPDEVELRLAYNGSWSVSKDGLLVWKFDSTLSVGASDRVLIWTERIHHWVKYNGTSKMQQIQVNCYLYAILENFTLNTLTRAQLEALTVAGDDHEIMGVASSSSKATDLGGAYATASAGNEYAQLCTKWEPAGAQTIYGVALYFDDTITCTGDTPTTNDEADSVVQGTSSSSDVFVTIVSDTDTGR